jgi:hypothetical protein
MRRFFVFVLVALILCGALKMAVRPYEMCGEVVADKGAVVVVKLSNGYKYEVETKAFKYREGDKIIATVQEKGATTPKDDKVIGLKLA